MYNNIVNFDENGNLHLRFFVPPWSFDEQALIDSLRKEKPMEPISNSYYKATSPSMDYVHDAINIISNLLNERKTELTGNDYEMVFVWDIGDITTFTNQHIAQSLLSHRETNAHSLINITNRILENTNFCPVFDRKNVVNIEDVFQNESEDVKKRAPMYDELEKVYNKLSNGMRDDGPIINYELMEKCRLTYRARDMYLAAVLLQRLFHQRWKTARKCLEMVNKQSSESHKAYANVVLCEDGIGNGAAQLLLSGTSKYIPFENIYSYHKDSMEMVFKRIQKRFGEKCVLVYVTSSLEVSSICEKLKIPIWKIRANDSIEHLCNALKTVWV